MSNGVRQRQEIIKPAIKVETERIDQVMDAVGELVVIKSQLINEAAPYLGSNSKLTSIISLLDRSIRDLLDKALNMRLTPLKSTFLKMQRVVKDVSIKFNKQVDLVFTGETTEIDRTMVEALADPLLHLVRNCLDHGIEKPEARKASGKPSLGTITLSAITSGGRVIIEITDDGAGINKKKLFEKAKSRGFIASAKSIEECSEDEIFKHIFDMGVSTADKVTDLSGRGVGMDVVKSNVEKLGGFVAIQSQEGKGTTFQLSLPLSASIAEGILVEVNGQPVLIPLRSVSEIIDGRKQSLVDIENRGNFFKFRDKMIPIVKLSELLKSYYPNSGIKTTPSEDKIVVVVDYSARWLALEVTQILGQSQVVQKKLNGVMENFAYIGGAAILGDGRVALVVEMSSLFSAYSRQKKEVVA